MWWLCTLALAQDPAAPIEPADGFGTGRGVALGGLTMGIAGNLVSFAGTLVAISEVNPETGVLTPEGFQIVRPYKAIGVLVLHGIGAPTMAAGTLQMRRANKLAGIQHTAAWGRIALGLGFISAAANTTAFVSDSPTDADRQLTAGALGTVGAATGAVSFGFGVVQYVVPANHRPPKRRPVGVDARARPTFALGPTGPTGVALSGTW